MRTNLHVLGVESAGELAEVMGAVGLLQNLAALRALATEGIQRGHMAMHARSVALSAGVPRAWVYDVVARMVEQGTIHADGARAAYAAIRREDGAEVLPGEVLARARASGKVILLGEHAVVHGCPALAASLDRGVEVVCRKRKGAAWVEAPALPLSGYLFTRSQDPVRVALRKVLECLGTSGDGLSITLDGELPPGKGLGSSAALSVAALRAVSQAVGRPLDQDTLLAYAGEVERVFHGNPSGVDHTVSVKGGVIRYQRGTPPVLETVPCARSWPIVLLDSGEVGPTSVQVGRVLSLLEAEPDRVQAIFDEIRTLVDTGVDALKTGDADTLGQVMVRNHALLQALNVSTPRLDALVDLAMQAGAAGAKLTGAGGGGMVVALCPDGTEDLLAAAAERGISALAATIPARTTV